MNEYVAHPRTSQGIIVATFRPRPPAAIADRSPVCHIVEKTESQLKRICRDERGYHCSVVELKSSEKTLLDQQWRSAEPERSAVRL
jgi:hypothetical protein